MILILFLLAFSLPVFASRTVVTQYPYNSYMPAYWGGDYIPDRNHNVRRTNSRFSDINELEKYSMNRNFMRDSDIARLERLEMKAFGAVQTGDINTRYDNVRNAILSRPKNDYRTSLLKNIGNYFGGQVTGYTPSISDFDYPYGQDSVTNYSSPWGKGIRTNRYGIGTGSSIRILD